MLPFEITLLELVKHQVFVQKKKIPLNLGPKMLYLSAFRFNFKKLFSYFKLALSYLSKMNL